MIQLIKIKFLITVTLLAITQHKCFKVDGNVLLSFEKMAFSLT